MVSSQRDTYQDKIKNSHFLNEWWMNAFFSSPVVTFIFSHYSFLCLRSHGEQDISPQFRVYNGAQEKLIVELRNWEFD